MLIYLIVLFMGGYILQCGIHILDSSKRLCFFSCAYYVLTYSRPGCCISLLIMVLADGSHSFSGQFIYT